MAVVQQTMDNRPLMYILALICFERLRIIDSSALISDDRNQTDFISTEAVKFGIGANFDKTCTTDAECMSKDPNSVCKVNFSNKNKTCVCAQNYQHLDNFCRNHGNASTSVLGLSPAAEKSTIIGGCIAGVIACCVIAGLVYLSRWRSSQRKDKQDWIRTHVGQISEG